MSQLLLTLYTAWVVHTVLIWDSGVIHLMDENFVILLEGIATITLITLSAVTDLATRFVGRGKDAEIVKNKDVKISGKLTKCRNNPSAYGCKNIGVCGRGIAREAQETSSTSQFIDDP